MFRRSDFKKLELFGGGKKNTKVFKVEYIKTGMLYALKEVEAKSLDKLNEYKEEAVQLSRVQKHPNILQMFGYYFYETSHNTFKLGIISEYINRDLNLETIYRKREKQHLYWKEDKLLTITYNLIDTFAYLESLGICHRDIKPTNLFILDNNQIKVIDFGESIEFFDEDEDKTQMATIRGTPQYLSPILWEAHVILQAKEIEHNMFKSDVFSTGLVMYQLASMKDVSGYNQKTDQCDGEILIRDGLKRLSKTYSSKLIDIIAMMLIFDEGKRPTFIDLGQIIAGKDYKPRNDMSLIEQFKQQQQQQQVQQTQTSTGNNINNIDSNSNKSQQKQVNQMKSKIDSPKFNSNKLSTETGFSSSNISNTNNIVPIAVSLEDKIKKFSERLNNTKIKFNMSKSAYWFEYGGSLMAKYPIKSSNDENAKWKLLPKNKFIFPFHVASIYIDELYGHYVIGGNDGQISNTFQFKDNAIIAKSAMVIQRSFMSLAVINHFIFAIGGYDYIEKNQLSSIDVYDIENDQWQSNLIKDLNIARSQAAALVYNSKTIYVFGGFNKVFGTLNSIEKIDIEIKECELIHLKIPISLRRFIIVKVSEDKSLIIGGITKVSKRNDDSFIVDFNRNTIAKYKEMPFGGIIEQEVVFDDSGQMHLFFESNYGLSTPDHFVFDYISNF